MILFKSKLERNRFFRFMIVGTIGAIIDFVVMNILTHQLKMELVLAGSISFICAVISNFIWNRFWTYPDSRSRPLGNQLTMFFLVNLAGAGIRIPILYYVEPAFIKVIKSNILPPTISNEFLAKNITLAMAITIVMLWNFFVNRYWTYNDIKSKKDLTINMFPNEHKIIPFYTSKGDAEVFMLYPHLFNRLGEWVGWITPEKEVYSVLGAYVGYISRENRILRKRNLEMIKPFLTPPPSPKRVMPPATIPLAPLMSELLYSTVDVLLEEPERLHTIDTGEFKQDLD